MCTLGSDASCLNIKLLCLKDASVGIGLGTSEGVGGDVSAYMGADVGIGLGVGVGVCAGIDLGVGVGVGVDVGEDTITSHNPVSNASFLSPLSPSLQIQPPTSIQ